MLERIAAALASFLLNFIWGKIQLWWAQRQAAYYRKKSEIEQRRMQSLQEGKAAEEAISQAGDTVVLHANKASAYEDKVAELQRRAAERAAKK